WIARPDAPLAIKYDLNYFWDPKYFPNLQEKCVHFVTSNSKKDFDMCDMKGMKSCSRRIDAASELKRFSFLTPESDQLTTFGWLCPNHTVCCEWECCDPEKHSSGGLFFVLMVVVLIGVVVCIAGCVDVDEMQEYSPAERHGRAVAITQM
ncbi:hypothetical protein PMAYCL1PPCAC_26427, partial [Pristionchus mayeri]